MDGPDSPHHGRGAWTWYTGSAAWLHRVVAEWVLGVRPDWDGLRIDPCLPPGWDRARMVRPWRGATWEIDDRARRGERRRGRRGADRGNVIPVPKQAGGRHQVHATFV